MSNPSKAKGTSFESACVDYFRANGYPNCERRALAGALDKGDLTGIPVVVECKNVKAINLAAFVDEAVVEATNAGAPLGIAVIKRRGRSDAGEAYAVMRLSDAVELIRGWDQ